MSGLTLEQQRIAKLALHSGFYQHQVAAHFGINQGRISEFKNSQQFHNVEAARDLPVGFPKGH